MKNRAIVSERGTVTIPEPIREEADIHPGDIIEFKPEKNRIILKHLLVKQPDEEDVMSHSEWEKFDKLIQKQLKSGRYTGYVDLEKARQHSRRLMKKSRRGAN